MGHVTCDLRPLCVLTRVKTFTAGGICVRPKASCHEDTMRTIKSLAVSVLALLLALRLVAGQNCPEDGDLSFDASGVCDANVRQGGAGNAASLEWGSSREVEEVERDKRDAASMMRKKSDSPAHLDAIPEGAHKVVKRDCEDDGNLDKSSCEDRAPWRYSKAPAEDDEFQNRPFGVDVSDDAVSWSQPGPFPEAEDDEEMNLRARRMSQGDNAASMSWTVVPAESDDEDEQAAERHRRQNNFRRGPVKRGFYRGQGNPAPQSAKPSPVTPAPATAQPRTRAWQPRRNHHTRVGVMLPPYNNQDFQPPTPPTTTTTTTPPPPQQRPRRPPLNEAELWRAWRKISAERPQLQQVPVNNTDLWNAWLKYSADRGAGGHRRYRRPNQEGAQTTTTTTTPPPPLPLGKSRMMRYTRVSALGLLSSQLQGLANAADQLSRQLRSLAEETGGGGN